MGLSALVISASAVTLCWKLYLSFMVTDISALTQIITKSGSTFTIGEISDNGQKAERT